VDRRVAPRRAVIRGTPRERRSVVDRRFGAERRSTVERRGRAVRRPAGESPSEHLRNGLQLLTALRGELQREQEVDLGAALERIQRAIQLLERRTNG
jgi:hypothetical protein